MVVTTGLPTDAASRSDFGIPSLYDGKAVKVTTDEVELDHAEILVGKKTNNFVFVYKVERLQPKLGIITMAVMSKLKKDIPEEFYDKLEKEAKNLGIDPEELDIRPENFGQDPKSGNIKMLDV